MCAPEHLRALSEEEEYSEDPDIKQVVQDMREAHNATEFEDLTEIQPTTDELADAVERLDRAGPIDVQNPDAGSSRGADDQ